MPRKVLLRIACVTFVIATGSLVLVFAEQRRTEGELANVLSAYLSEGILHDAHDWGPGQRILLVIQSEPEQLGKMRLGLSAPFVGRLNFQNSSPITRISFLLTNAMSRRLRIEPHLPTQVRFIIVNRD